MPTPAGNSGNMHIPPSWVISTSRAAQPPPPPLKTPGCTSAAAGVTSLCFDAANGKLIWSVNVPKETGCRTPEWGFGGSPLLFKDLVVLNMGEAGTALDKSTGKIVWRSGKKDAAYSTPVPVRFNDQWLGLFANGASYLAVNLETGKELWRIRWLTQGGINVADPLVSGEKFMISSGYAKGSELLKMGPGDPTVVWKNREFSTHISPGVLLGHELYCDSGQASSGGPLICVDFDTGKQKWEFPNVGTGGLMIAGGKLIAMTEHGEIMVGPANPSGFTPTARASARRKDLDAARAGQRPNLRAKRLR